MKKILIMILLLVTAAVQAAATRNPSDHFFQQTFGDLKEELVTAKEEGKQGILIMFETTDCPWCAKMEANVLNRADVQDYFRAHFRIFPIDTAGDVPVVDFSGKEMPQKDFAFKHNRIRATPVFVFFGLDGKEMVKYTGATRNAEEFMWLGEFVVNGHYKKGKPFTAYKREKLAAAGK